jgi:hypothetical protein
MCEFGNLDQIVDDGIGINSNGILKRDACLVSKEFGNQKCSGLI